MTIASICKKAMLAFLSCTCSLTGVAHAVNIVVTRTLIREGIEVPTYFQIGYWPSVEMATDYLAWGFFAGLGFLCPAIGMKDKANRSIRINLSVCGVLCLLVFFGAIFVNENLWYVAPMGYGIGAMILCIQMLKCRNIKSRNRIRWSFGCRSIISFEFCCFRW